MIDYDSLFQGSITWWFIPLSKWVITQWDEPPSTPKRHMPQITSVRLFRPSQSSHVSGAFPERCEAARTGELKPTSVGRVGDDRTEAVDFHRWFRWFHSYGASHSHGGSYVDCC